MPELPPRCCSFFESDDEYPDLQCRELAAKRYLHLIYTVDYRSKPFINDDPDREGLPSPTNNLPLPTNVVTIGRRITPALRTKILQALDVLPTKGQIRVKSGFINFFSRLKPVDLDTTLNEKFGSIPQNGRIQL
ncbi:hypothetical protein QUA70_12465 [Microcoleus sp. LAD1_D5]|uniref:hypothetical protein n=1 Tax=unclassified Microcoleus TaxID=2642155 RepID=UPI002FD47EDA